MTTTDRELEGLRGRADQYRKSGPSAEHTARLLDEAATALSQASDRIKALEGVVGDFSGYAQHDNDCAANLNEPCDCGYSEVSRRARDTLAKLKASPGSVEEEGSSRDQPCGDAQERCHQSQSSDGGEDAPQI